MVNRYNLIELELDASKKTFAYIFTYHKELTVVPEQLKVVMDSAVKEGLISLDLNSRNIKIEDNFKEELKKIGYVNVLHIGNEETFRIFEQKVLKVISKQNTINKISREQSSIDLKRIFQILLEEVIRNENPEYNIFKLLSEKELTNEQRNLIIKVDTDKKEAISFMQGKSQVSSKSIFAHAINELKCIKILKSSRFQAFNSIKDYTDNELQDSYELESNELFQEFREKSREIFRTQLSESGLIETFDSFDSRKRKRIGNFADRTLGIIRNKIDERSKYLDNTKEKGSIEYEED